MGGIYEYKRPGVVLVTNAEGEEDQTSGELCGNDSRGSSVEGVGIPCATSNGDVERTDRNAEEATMRGLTKTRDV